MSVSLHADGTISEAGGFTACSRWLSEATPTDPVPPEFRTPAGVPAIVVATNHDGIPPGCGNLDAPPSGGVARASLNHRLHDFIPPGYRIVLETRDVKSLVLRSDCLDAGGISSCSPTARRHSDAGGISSCSRWLSEATPPDPVPPEFRTPAGVPANARHAIHTLQPSLPPHLCHQEPGTHDHLPLACRTPLLPRWCRQRSRCVPTGSRWRGRSCPSLGFPEIHPLPRGFHAGIEKILILMDSRLPSAFFPMARGLRRFHRQRIGAGIGETIHRQSGRTSPGQILPRGVDRIPKKVRCGIRRTVSRLNCSTHRTLLASLRDAESFMIHGPVVSLRSTTGYHISSLRDAESFTIHGPVVSLRSTTGYHISSLRDHLISPTPVAHHHGMPEASHPVAGGRAKRHHRTPCPPNSAPRQGCHHSPNPPPILPLNP